MAASQLPQVFVVDLVSIARSPPAIEEAIDDASCGGWLDGVERQLDDREPRRNRSDSNPSDHGRSGRLQRCAKTQRDPTRDGVALGAHALDRIVAK
ncbi:MAG TPA: hypothetical protein VK034_29840 [Enhygromyxa sp.]|nr:hypothetical protein [Enhygromyxa sp.]